MLIEFRCPHCSHRLSVREERAGKETHCVYCGDRIHVPTSAPHPTHDELLVKSGVVREGGLARADRTPIIARIIGVCVLVAVGYFGYRLVSWIRTPVEPTDYVEYVCPKNTFSISIPEGCAVKEEEVQLTTSDGKPLACRYYRMNCGLYDMKIKVLDAQFDAWHHGRMPMDLAVDAIRQEMQGTGISISKIENISRPPYNLRRCHGSGSKENERDAVAEAYILRNRSYVLVVQADRGRLEDSPTVTKFFDSFKVLNP